MEGNVSEVERAFTLWKTRGTNALVENFSGRKEDLIMNCTWEGKPNPGEEFRGCMCELFETSEMRT